VHPTHQLVRQVGCASPDLLRNPFGLARERAAGRQGVKTCAGSWEKQPADPRRSCVFSAGGVCDVSESLTEIDDLLGDLLDVSHVGSFLSQGGLATCYFPRSGYENLGLAPHRRAVIADRCMGNLGSG
jgi:hypothetical protein